MMQELFKRVEKLREAATALNAFRLMNTEILLENKDCDNMLKILEGKLRKQYRDICPHKIEEIDIPLPIDERLPEETEKGYKCTVCGKVFK